MRDREEALMEKKRLQCMVTLAHPVFEHVNVEVEAG